MIDILQRAGLRVSEEDGTQLTVPKGYGPVDLGTMERRQLVVAQKPLKLTAVDAVDSQDADTFCASKPSSET